MIPIETVAGALGSALLFFAANTRFRSSRFAAATSIAVVALAATVVARAHVDMPAHPFSGFYLPMAALGIAIAMESFFIARWLTPRLGLPVFLPAFLALATLGAGATMTVVVAIYPGS